MKTAYSCYDFGHMMYLRIRYTWSWQPPRAYCFPCTTHRDQRWK